MGCFSPSAEFTQYHAVYQTYQDLTPAKCLRECIAMGSDNRFAGNTLLRLIEPLDHTYIIYRKQFGCD